MSLRALTTVLLSLALLASCSGRSRGNIDTPGARDSSPPLVASDSDALAPAPNPGTGGGARPGTGLPPVDADTPVSPIAPPSSGGSRGGGGGAAVPEPGTLLLVGTGLAGAALARRRRRAQIEQNKAES